MCMRLPLSPWSIAEVPSSQALPNFPITAPPSVCVPAVIGALTVWIQTPKKNHWCVTFKHVACLWMCVLFYVSFVCLHVCAYASKFKVHCWSASEPGASGLPDYCTPPVCVPDVIGALAVWQQKNNPKFFVSCHGCVMFKHVACL